MIKIYTSPTCGICKVIKMKLNNSNIPFEETMEYDTLVDKDIFTLPVIELEDGTLLTSPVEMNKWIEAQGE